MPPTPHLPDELLSLIFEALWDSLRFYDSGEERLDLGTTAAELIGPCRLVSTRWNLLALPVLVKSVKTKKPGMLLELAQRYGLSHQVKELVVGFEVTSAHPQLPPLLWSLYMSTNRAGLIELPGFLSAQRASELELLEIEVIHPPSSRSEAYAASMDALRQIDAICGSRGIILAHNLPEPKVVPHWRSPLTEQPAQEDEQWNWYGKVVEPENAPWPTQRDPWAPPLEDLPSEDSFSSDDDEDSLDYDAEDDERFAPFWSEEKRNEVFGHNTGVDGTEDARTSSATVEGKS